MLKNILLILVALLSVGYLLGVIFYFDRDNPPAGKCRQVEIVISDSLETNFLTTADVVAYLKKKGQYPLNKNQNEINTHLIEKALTDNNIVKQAEVVRTVSGKIRIVISQKMPILRVFSSSEGSYFVDRSGGTMSTITGQAIYVPIASGNINKAYASTQLLDFALFIDGSDYWRRRIKQIVVRSERDVELVVSEGGQRVLLGSLDNYATKLDNLRLFYEQVIPRTGWQKYSVINLRYKKQIVCTKN
ncbi:MAG: cell division protein FtsQ/DivIB [Tannerella sp.]|jgi:cell division protein FtsQ|nr:cell division protein FtsQ/DivIB [Tannerella sp.]